MKAIGYVFMVVALCLCVSSAYADNITIKDETGSSPDPWYSPNKEDQEVEPGNVKSQAWDLEAFFLNGKTLTMVGGYNFTNGESGFLPGDIFFDVTGDVQYGVSTGIGSDGYQTVTNTWGYDYVMHFTSLGTNYNYDIYSIDGDSLMTVYYKQNQGSNPFRWAEGGTKIGSGQFAYATGLTGSSFETDLLGSSSSVTSADHNALSVDIGFLGSDIDFTVHYTYGCGNDNLMGQGSTPVPEPGSLMLLGLGLLGVPFIRRFKK